MSTDQIIVFAVIGVALLLFLWNRIRYDLVALSALLAMVLAGVVDPVEAFAGFGHPAVITVAAVLLISQGLMNAGVVGALSRHLTKIGDRPAVQVGVLSGMVALCSGLMNNVGALALFMPVGIWLARQSGRSPSFLLMPLAFASMCGGALTLIGTPPNIIISAYREQVLGRPYAMFDFLPVGAALTVAGVAFIALLGWRLIPQREEKGSSVDLFEINSYLTELRVPQGSKFSGETLRALADATSNDADFHVTALIRDGAWNRMPSRYSILRDGDILLIEADAENIKTLMDVSGLELAPAEESKERSDFNASTLELVEAIVAPNSSIVGQNANMLDLREQGNINILAVARQGRRLRERLDRLRFVEGDILLVQVHEDSMQDDLGELGLLPLASRGLAIGRPQKVWLAAGSFAITIALIAAGVLTAAVGMSLCALFMVLAGLVPLREIYECMEIPVLVLLAAMLPVGMALESTGGSTLIAGTLLSLGDSFSPAVMLTALMAAVILLTNILNNAAAAVLSAPIAISMAKSLAVSPDPFLMAVCLGASCAFITPIAHQSNTLVMAPGGYRFSDYWRMGLPLSILAIAVCVPVILLVWPL